MKKTIVTLSLVLGTLSVSGYSAEGDLNEFTPSWGKLSCQGNRYVGVNFWGKPMYEEHISYATESLEQCLSLHASNVEMNQPSEFQQLEVILTNKTTKKKYRAVIQEVDFE